MEHWGKLKQRCCPVPCFSPEIWFTKLNNAGCNSRRASCKLCILNKLSVCFHNSRKILLFTHKVVTCNKQEFYWVFVLGVIRLRSVSVRMTVVSHSWTLTFLYLFFSGLWTRKENTADCKRLKKTQKPCTPYCPRVCCRFPSHETFCSIYLFFASYR